MPAHHDQTKPENNCVMFQGVEEILNGMERNEWIFMCRDRGEPVWLRKQCICVHLCV